MTADDESFLLMNAYCDGELSPGEALDMERRLAADPTLSALAERLSALSSAMKPALALPPASPVLRSRIVQQIGFADVAPRRRFPEHWRSLAATLLVGLIGGAVLDNGRVFLGLPPASEQIADAVLAGHLRGLVAQQPYDIASSNRHVVKPWFNGRTTIAPDAPDLAAEGFPLIGGRIDIVGGKAVPTLVYRRDQHVISVTVTPHAAEGPPGETRHGGSTIERWAAGDLDYWAVSDVAIADLRAFTGLFRAQTSNTP